MKEALGFVVAVSALLASATRDAHGQHFSPSERQALPVGWTGMTRSALVDLDGDGALDYFSGGANYYRNNGHGRFAAAPLPASVGALRAIGDFDGDGDDDLLLAYSVLENRGAAGLVVRPSSVQSLVLATGDLNGDGREDLVYPGGVGLATSVNTFSFVSATAGSGAARAAAITDIDGDGDRDIVWGISPTSWQTPWGTTTTFPGHECVSLNAGNGTFTHASPFPNPPDDDTAAAFAFDIDGDGDVDCGFLSGTWKLWRNQGGGSFVPWGAHPLGSSKLLVNDLDLDGDPDLVGRDAWFENVGAGSFTRHEIAAAPSELHAIGDVDGDLDSDLLYGGLDSGVGPAATEPRLLLNQGGTSFIDATAPAWRALLFLEARQWLHGDLDGDGTPDVFEEGGQVWRNPGDGWHELSATPLTVGGTGWMLLVDIDTDGDPDVLQGRQLGLNDGTGGLAANATITVTPWQPVNPFLAFDADGDGDPDLLDSDHYQGFGILRNEGGLQFTTLPYVPWISGRADAIAAADFDGDGDKDLLVSSHAAGGSLHLYANDGTGAFTLVPNGVVGGTGTWVAELAVADLDLDGDLDVLAGRYLGSAPTHLVLKNQGGVLIEDPAAVPAHAGAVRAALGDVDADGDPDAVVGILTGGSPAISLALWINDGTGAFSFAANLALPFNDPVTLTDVDGDGDADLFANKRLLLSRHWHIEAPFLAQTGTDYELHFGGRAMPNALALPWFGTRASIPTPFGTLGIDPLTAIPLAPVQITGEMGQLSFPIPPTSALVGMPFSMQAMLLSGSALHLTPPKHEIVRS